MTQKLHDILRVLQWILPALGALYAALADIWGLPAADKIVGTIAAVVAFIGVCLEYDSKRYFTDKIIVENEQIRENLPE